MSFTVNRKFDLVKLYINRVKVNRFSIRSSLPDTERVGNKEEKGWEEYYYGNSKVEKPYKPRRLRSP